MYVQYIIQRYILMFFMIRLQSIVEYVGEEKLQKFINFVLKRFSEITLPCKRYTPVLYFLFSGSLELYIC